MSRSVMWLLIAFLLSLFGAVGTVWLGCYLSSNYGPACMVQFLAFSLVGGSAAYLFFEEIRR